jgi:hypothetical protein
MKILKKNYSLLSVAPYLTLGLVMGFQLFRSKIDMWDGTIISYAAKTGDFEGIKHWFFDSNYQIQYFLIRLTAGIAEFLGVSFHTFNILIILFALCVVISQTKVLACKIFGLSREFSIFAACLVAVMPVWNTLVSSVLTYHVLALGLGLFGFKLLLDKSKTLNACGLLFCGISFQLNSMLLFLPSLALVAFLTRTEAENKKIRLQHTGILLALATLYFTLIRTFHPPTGEFVGYNGFVTPFNIDWFTTSLIDIKGFLTFLVIPILVLLIFTPLIVSRSKSQLKDRMLATARNKRNYMLIALMIFSVIPYLAVGKHANIRDFTDWSGRQGFTLVVPLAIFTASMLETFIGPKDSAFVTTDKWLVFTAFFSLISISSILVLGLATKINRQDFEFDLRSELTDRVAEPAPGTLQIIGDGIPGPIFRGFESNFLLFETYGKIVWWSRISNSLEESFEIPALISKSIPASNSLFEKSLLNCRTLIRLDVVGYVGRLDALRSFFKLPQERHVRILSIEDSC